MTEGAPARGGAATVGLAALRARLVHLAALATLLGALFWLASAGLRVFGGLALGGVDAVAKAYGLVFAAALLMAFAPSRRREVLLAVSAAAFVWLIGVQFVPIALYCALLCVLARSGMRLRWQIAGAAALWLSLPLLRAYVFPAWQVGLAAAMILWAQLAYASLYVLVERARWMDEKPSVIDDLAYLLALPRLAEPFFQPISPRYFYSSEVATPTLGLAARGLGLGLLGAALGVVAAKLRVLEPAEWLGEPGHVIFSVALLYLYAASQIFVSVALFRLLGFDLSSGMRQPFLARSFRDWFQRWNHYVRDAVVSLFLFPLQGWLRRRVGPTTARIVAGYVAIFVGSFLLNDLLVVTVTSIDPMQGVERAAPLRRMLMFAVYWSAIVLPGAGLAVTARERSASLPRKIFEVVRFLALFLGLFYLSHRLAIRLNL